MTTATPSPRNSIWKVITPIIVILGLAIGGLYLIKSYAPQNHSSAEIRVGAKLPDFTLKQFSGGSIPISQVPGKVFLINFWASWCDSCMVEMPSIVKLRQTYFQRGFEVIPINVDENPGSVLPKLMQEFGMKFPVYVDPEGTASELFDVHAIPLTVMMNKSREILLIESGEKDWTGRDIRSKLEQWLEK